MNISLNLSEIRRTTWQEYSVRFFFGGLITLLTGVIAHKFGPVTGGLFLAFPAIFPASATLIEKHVKEKRQRAGMSGTTRGREAAALDACGTALGSLGLVGFAMVAWRMLPYYAPGLVLSVATVIWLSIAAFAWRVRRAF